jgi:hypothetical protein
MLAAEFVLRLAQGRDAKGIRRRTCDWGAPVLRDVWWAVVGCAALTAVAFSEAWAVTSGRLRKWPERYAATDAPANLRHGFAVLWPAGVSCALLTLAFVFLAVGHAGAAAAAVLLILGSGYLWHRWTSHPPEWMKPEWLRAREDALRRGEQPPPPEGVENGRIVTGPIQYYGTWALIGGVTVAAIVLRQWSLLVGAAVGLPYAMVQGRRRRRG